MYYNFSTNDLFYFLSFGALLITAIYHSILFYYNRIKLLGNYSFYLWISLFFIGFASFTRNNNKNDLLYYLIGSLTLWTSYAIYFRFILSTITPSKIKESVYLRFAYNNWFIFIAGFITNITVHLISPNLVQLFSTIALLFNSSILILGIIILYILFKEKNIYNKNILGGAVCMIFFNIFNIIALYNKDLLFGLTSVSYISLGYFTEIIFFSIAISHKMRHDVNEKYNALTEIKNQELKLAIERKKASDILMVQDFKIKNERAKAIMTQRAEIGRKLHDDLSGSLVALRFLVQDFSSKAENKIEKEKFNIIAAELETLYVDTRNYSHELSVHPALSANKMSYDIWAYLNKLKEQFSSIGLLTIHTTFNANELDQLNTIQTKHIYSVLKECITNTIKHTNAQNIWIGIEFTEQCSIRYIDDGKGLTTIQEGIGIKGMRKRMNDLGGAFDISTSENGTKTTLSFKIN